MKRLFWLAFRMVTVALIVGACILKANDPGLATADRVLLFGCGAVWLVAGAIDAAVVMLTINDPRPWE